MRLLRDWKEGFLRRFVRGGKWFGSTLSLVGFLGAIVTGHGVIQWIASHSSALPGDRLATWLWALLTLSVVTGAVVLLVMSQVAEDTHERRIQRHKDNFAHVMAETVRRAIVAPLDLDGALTIFRDYTTSLLGTDVVVTVKVHQEGELRTIARCGTRGRRPNRPCLEPIAHSHIIDLFYILEDDQKQVMVRDVSKELPASQRDYKHKAERYAFRSVLAFPLREPTEEAVRYSTNSVMGFVSLDCENAEAFDRLFSPESLGSGAEQTYKPLHDLDIFYFLADSIAAGWMLESKKQETG